MPATNDLLAELTCGDDERAERAAKALAEVGAEVLPALSALLASADADERWWGVRTLAQMPEPRTEWLTAALNDPSAEVRAAAALALASHPNEQAAPLLVERLGDGDGVVSSLCVNALQALGNAAVPALTEAFPLATARGRIQIMRTLVPMRDPRVIRLMLSATEAESAALNYWAQAGLETLGLNMVYLRPE